MLGQREVLPCRLRLIADIAIWQRVARRRRANYKRERALESTPGLTRRSRRTARSINLCANNYLRLVGNERVVARAKAGLDAYGHGMSSVRFICGTSTVHGQLESCRRSLELELPRFDGQFR